MSKIVTPSNVLIERTALEFAAEYYEIGRSQGMKSKYKNARVFAAHNLERFIPLATEQLINMLGSTTVPAEQKAIIHQALIERVNDPLIASLPSLPEIDIKKLIPTKPLPPVIINTTKPEFNIEKQTLPMKGA